MRRFEDRRHAGQELGKELVHLHNSRPVVVGLPRGGVEVAYEVARALAAPLDVIVVRKVGVPGQPELAMGAVGEGGAGVVNERIVRIAGVTPAEYSHVETRERAEVEQRADRFRPSERRVPLAGRTVIVVDDGIATGATARAALQVARAQGASRVVLAVPVGAAETLDELAADADELVTVLRPSDLGSVGSWYRDFDQVSDEEVRRLLSSPPLTVPNQDAPAPSD
jgi:putative phosphoribosyl transferase